MADITKPILLDETGQQIYGVLQEIKAVLQGQGGGGNTPSGTLTIKENGQFDVTAYASVIVEVPVTTYPNGDEVEY